jgi:hypothetical protein
MAISNEIQENKPKFNDMKVNYGSTQVLKMVMYNGNSQKFTWNIKYPNTNVTKTTVEALINEMSTDEFLYYKNAEVSGLDDAYIYETSTIEIPSN